MNINMVFSKIVLSLLFLLVFVLNIPETIGVRNAIVYILFIFLVYISFRNKLKIKQLLDENKMFKMILLLLLFLSVYIFFHSIFISHESFWSLDEFRGQWITPMLYFVVGILLASFFYNQSYISPQDLLTVLFYSMFLHIFYVDLVAFDKFLINGNLISRYGGLTGSPVLANYLTNILLAMLISEIVYRLRTQNKMLNISNALLYIYLFLVVLSSLIEGMRHGSIALFFLGFGAIIVFLYKNKNYTKKIKLFISLFLILSMSLPLAYNLKYDTRWGSLFETIDISLDIENNKYWLNRKYEIPKLSNGSNVSGSNYERMAWAYVGSKFIIENPLGIGFGRNAFGHTCELYYGEDAQRGYHSHSSLIDFTLGVGVIGLILWLSIIFLIIKGAISSFKNSINYYSMFVFFITMGFFTRSIVDSNMRDHMFLQFMLMLGISLILMVYYDRKQKS